MDHVTFTTNHSSSPRKQSTDTRPKKQRRISRACDFCNKRSIRCMPSADESSTLCQNCLDFNVPCTYNRPTKKRGIKSGGGIESGTGNSASENGASRDGESDARMLLELTNRGQGSGSHFGVRKLFIPEQHKSMAIKNEEKIRDLVDFYFEVLYPMFPIFHKPSTLPRVMRNEYLNHPQFFAAIMAVCALASARARDGALFPVRWAENHFQGPPSEIFFIAAKDVISHELGKVRGLDWMRACALLSLYGVQIGNREIMHQYLGLYDTLVALDSLHDEKNWPPETGIIESEMRRRLFWFMYTFEVFLSVVWGSINRCRESQSHVMYPNEIDDEFFDDAGYKNHSSSIFSVPFNSIQDPLNWLHGWNFITDLYRILEHVMDNFHRRRSLIRLSSQPDLFSHNTPPASAVLSRAMLMYNNLPSNFKEVKPPPLSAKGIGLEERLSFQAANIIATLQLLRMILFTSEEATVDQKYVIARDLLNSFANIPIFFLRAMSTPLLHHLAGIGSILGSVVESPMSEASYLQVREVLLAMADLLASLEAGIKRNVGAAHRLRSLVTIIDEYMSVQRRIDHSSSNITYPGTFAAPGAKSNNNIDPSLQSGIRTSGVATGAMYAMNDSISNGFDYPAIVPLTGATEHIGQFQLPSELLEQWPWSFDMTRGFANSQWGLGVTASTCQWWWDKKRMECLEQGRDRPSEVWNDQGFRYD